MIETSRRSFITGLVATSVVAACPMVVEAALAASPKEEWQAWFKKWVADASAVLVECQTDQILFGISVWRQSDAYPYVERINPFDLCPPTEKCGLWKLVGDHS